MNLLLIRDTFTDKSTTGRLYIEDSFECYTLEDVVRENKIYGKTAIPEGRYEVVLDISTRFKKELPRLLNVHNFEGIRIHAGNKAEDTEGCILVGITRKENWIGCSKIAMDSLMSKLKSAKCPIYIKVMNNG
jgi:hypothetical protein